MVIRYILAYFSIRWDGANHTGAKQYAANQVRIARRMRVETWGRL